MSIRSARPYFPLFLLMASLVFQFTVDPLPSLAGDYSHARVVRLSLVQGEVKVSRTGDSENGSATGDAWEQAVINLPIREGFVLATGQGRTEVEFESGAAAYLAENSILRFTELALSAGARITRLTLTQGTATIFANPSQADSFVVKTPVLEVSLTKKGRIRLDTYDDGASVSALRGEAVVASAAGTNRINKGQSLSVRSDNPNSASIGSIPNDDEWDRWVADREESVQSTATMAANRLNSPYYQAGVAELSVYGTWISYGGYDNCWRPIGVGLGWRPFSSGRWSFYPGFGWTWVSAEPWGWLPYHFGGWVFSPVYGWLWVPGQPHQWQADFRPATAVFVQVNNHIGWLPSHPLDRRGARPLNIENGLLTENGAAHVVPVPVSPEERVQVLGDAPRGLRSGEFNAAAPPQRVSRRFGDEQGPEGRERKSSGIVYDGRERRFVNANPPPAASSDNPEQDNRARWNGGARDQHHVLTNVPEVPGQITSPAPSVPAPAVPSAPVVKPRDRREGGFRDRSDSHNEKPNERQNGGFGNNPPPAPVVQSVPEVSRPVAPQEPAAPANVPNFRRMNREDDNFDRSDSPRNRPQFSTAPRESMPPMRTSPPPAQPRAETARPMPMPAPAPRAEPVRPPAQYSPPAAPRYSPPPSAPAPSSPRGGGEFGSNRGESKRPHQQQWWL